LPNAPLLFQTQEDLAAELTPGVPPPTTIRAALVIRGVTFDLLLGDEDAKLNLNSLYHHGGPERTQRTVAELFGGPMPAVRLLPAVQPMLIAREGRQLSPDSESEEAEEPEIPDAFRSWGEVFDLPLLESQVGSGAAVPNVTTEITCWGSGQLNFRRASDQAILAVVGSVVQDGAAKRILTRYRSRPEASLAVLLQGEITNGRYRDRLRGLLSETSNNFSLWIDASSPQRGSIRHFTVMQRDQEGETRQLTFMH
jgi:hypothetical protein